jgi:predicted nucleotidyltransferase
MKPATPFDGPPPGGPIAAEIDRRLAEVEAAEGVVIVLAVESGSRAWGFASPDSDYDVRFIFVRPTRDYLSVRPVSRRDVLERPIRDAIDLNGWDLRKALGLLLKSNPALHEWVRSPFVYREHARIAAGLRDLATTFWSSAAGSHHYLNMARRNVEAYLGGSRVRYKKYFYVLRPLLAARWIEQGRGPVPLEFERLLEATLGDGAPRAEIERLLATKRVTSEMGEGPSNPELDAFISAERARLESRPHVGEKPRPEAESVDTYFRDTLRILWGCELPA